MKKLIAILFVMIIPCCAVADSMDEIIASWNGKTLIFDVPKLSTDQLSDGAFRGDGWSVAFMEEYGEIRAIGVSAKDTDLFLPMSIVAGMSLVKDYEISEMLDFIGKVTYSYFKLLNGKESVPAFFGLKIFNIKKVENEYLFTIGEI